MFKKEVVVVDAGFGFKKQPCVPNNIFKRGLQGIRMEEGSRGLGGRSVFTQNTRDNTQKYTLVPGC